MSQPSLQEWLDRKPAGPKPKKPIPRINKGRAKERRQYGAQHGPFLELHPFCQIYIAMHGLDEDQVIAAGGRVHVPAYGCVRQVPAATQVHHRNKCYGVRLNDERWWMAASGPRHELVEADKTWARKEGYLLPLEADEDGRLPDGSQSLTTRELLLRKRN